MNSLDSNPSSFSPIPDIEEGGMVGNSHGHNSNRGGEPSSPSHNPEEIQEGGEKSVLQAKLTNLAIQIGYAGKFMWIFAKALEFLVSALLN